MDKKVKLSTNIFLLKIFTYPFYLKFERFSIQDSFE